MLVGRSRSCHLYLEGSHVSGTHATLAWTGQVWEVRDLGSRNGTFLNGQRLEPGQRAVLPAGSAVAFGDLDDAWRMIEDGPPAAVALCGTERRSAREGMLALPHEDAPEVCIYHDGVTWRADAGDRAWSVLTGQQIAAGGQQWTLLLPEDLRPTQELAPRSAQLSIAFRVSRDEEHIEMLVRAGGRTETLDHRAHSYLLLTLARARILSNAEQDDLPDSERGWLYHDDLARGIGCSEGHLNMLVFRARQHLASVGIADAQDIIERRRGSGQIRIGLSDLSVSSL